MKPHSDCSFVLAMIGIFAMNFVYASESLAVDAATRSQNVIQLTFESLPGADNRFGTADDEAARTCGTGTFVICSYPSSDYSSQFVQIISGTAFQGDFFPGAAPTNHYISSTPLIANLALERKFNQVSITSYSVWTATLWAFDEFGNVIGSDTLANPSAGEQPIFGRLSLETAQAIAHVKVLAEGCEPGASSCDRILNVDNLTLGRSVAAPTKTCTVEFSGTRQDTIVVPINWTVRSCNQYRSALGAQSFRLGCIFDDSFSISRSSGTIPLPNCGW